MRPPRQWSGRLGAVSLLIAVALTANGQPAPDAEPGERYRVLVERNIFSRSRRAPQGPPAPVATRPAGVAVDDTDQYLVLTGASKGDIEIAFIEDTRTGQTTRLRTGDAVGKGKIVTITLRNIEYEREGQIAKIEIGSNLTGSTVSAMPAATGPSTQPAEAADGAGPATDKAPPPSAAPGGAISVLERMRRRRQEQTDR